MQIVEHQAKGWAHECLSSSVPIANFVQSSFAMETLFCWVGCDSTSETRCVTICHVSGLSHYNQIVSVPLILEFAHANFRIGTLGPLAAGLIGVPEDQESLRFTGAPVAGSLKGSNAGAVFRSDVGDNRLHCSALAECDQAGTQHRSRQSSTSILRCYRNVCLPTFATTTEADHANRLAMHLGDEEQHVAIVQRRLHPSHMVRECNRRARAGHRTCRWLVAPLEEATHIAADCRA